MALMPNCSPVSRSTVKAVVPDGRAVAAQQRGDQARSGGLSTGSKVAIGVGAAALFGCRELGCFSRSKTSPGDPRQSPPMRQQPGKFQQQ